MHIMLLSLIIQLLLF